MELMELKLVPRAVPGAAVSNLLREMSVPGRRLLVQPVGILNAIPELVNGNVSQILMVLIAVIADSVMVQVRVIISALKYVSLTAVSAAQVMMGVAVMAIAVLWRYLTGAIRQVLASTAANIKLPVRAMAMECRQMNVLEIILKLVFILLPSKAQPETL